MGESYREGLQDVVAHVLQQVGAETQPTPDTQSADNTPPADFAEHDSRPDGSADPRHTDSAAPELADLNVMFLPPEPKSLEVTGLRDTDIEALVLKALMQRGNLTGREIASLIQLPHALLVEPLEQMRADLLISIKSSASLNDYCYHITDAGYQRGKRYLERSSYLGAAPVTLEDYCAGIRQQAFANLRLQMSDLRRAFDDLMLRDEMLSQLGQAINDGRGMFLYGPPGNGKTSIAERVTGAFGELVWIPRVLNIDGELIRVFDPSNHELVVVPQMSVAKYDRRWVLIRRPTIVVGGELTLEQLDLSFNKTTGINEAPVHLKANCGTLVIDDFGRQRVSSTEILNRLIVPMEKQYDYLNLASGRQVEVPFEQLLIFSTNLEPRELVDEAFLRRIPYKIEIGDPSEVEFRRLFESMAIDQGFTNQPGVLDGLLDRHYRQTDRPLRFCHPRDLLRQIKNLCEFHNRPLELSGDHMDTAVRNYFAGL